MNNDGMKLVVFEAFCTTCAHKDKREDEEPCNECLENPVNLYSMKPVKYQEKEK